MTEPPKKYDTPLVVLLELHGGLDHATLEMRYKVGGWPLWLGLCHFCSSCAFARTRGRVVVGAAAHMADKHFDHTWDKMGHNERWEPVLDKLLDSGWMEDGRSGELN